MKVKELISLLNYQDQNAEITVNERCKTTINQIISVSMVLDGLNKVCIQYNSNLDDHNKVTLMFEKRIRSEMKGYEFAIFKSIDGFESYLILIPENIKIPSNNKVGWDKANNLLIIGKEIIKDVDWE